MKFILAGALVCMSQLAFGMTQCITNGGFETGNIAPWQFTGFGQNVFQGPSAAHSGSFYLGMGRVNNGAQTIFQTITIPTNSVAAVLNYFRGVISSDTTTFDQLQVAVLTNLATAPTTIDLEDNSSEPRIYIQKTFDLTPYVGQTITLRFAVATGASGAMTTFYIDDVSVLAGTSADLPANDAFTNRLVLTGLSVTNSATNTFATKEPGEPNHAGNSGGRSLWWSWTAPTNGTVTLNTVGSSFVTLLAAYTGSVVSNLTQVAADSGFSHVGGTSQVKFDVAAGTEYEIAVDGNNGAPGVAVLHLNFQPDITAPTVSISSPGANAKLTNSTVVVQGKASDNVNVTEVQFRLENAGGTNAYQTATGTTNWSASLTGLLPGVNTVRVRALDANGNVSPTATRSFTFVIVSPLTLTVVGSGSVSPNLNGQLLNVGISYTVTAKALNSGFLFDGWTGGLTSALAKLTFVMQSNLVLQANFIPNPFIPVQGNYQGLFYDTNSPAPQSSGFFSATLKNTGGFSAKLLLAGKSSSLSGQFSNSGAFSNSIARKGLSPLSVQLQLDLAGDTLTGQISDGTWTAQLLANRAVYSKTVTAPQNGKYTLLIPGADASDEQPGGDSFGTVTVDTAGNISLSGTLADGTKLTQKTFVSGAGHWPFFASLYSGSGSIFGWLTFTNTATNDVEGLVTWFKLPQVKAKFYPAGFTNQTDILASRFLFTNNVPVLNFSTGQVWLANGNLSQNFTNTIVLGADNKITGTNKLTLSITTSSGLFKGSVPGPDTGKPISINGVVLEKQNFGGGFFLGTNQAGRVHFGP